jgi:hypothetical protein
MNAFNKSLLTSTLMMFTPPMFTAGHVSSTPQSRRSHRAVAPTRAQGWSTNSRPEAEFEEG